MVAPKIEEGISALQVDQLVAELLARGDMNDDTTIELNRILDEWRAGRVDPDDEAYIEALHARIMNLEPAEPSEIPLAAVNRIDGLTIEDWRDRALRAEATLADLEEAARNG
jgi:hypothetical protein